VATNAANAAGASPAARSERAQARKVLHGQPIDAAAWRSLCPAARQLAAAVSACARSRRLAAFIADSLARCQKLD
jgi:hypothetical protein